MGFDYSSLPKDMLIKSWQFTKTVHSDVYPSVDPTMPELSLAGKVAVITGASRGIGARGFAPAFARAGVKGLVLVATNAAKLQAVASDVHKINPAVKVLCLTADVSDQTQVEAAFREAKSTFGAADILVNNAGVSLETLGCHWADEDPRVWWDNFRVNSLGSYLVTRTFLRELLPARDAPATVISLTSGAALSIGSPFVHGSYCISKLAVQSMAVQLAAECPNITSVALDPYLVDTDMLPEHLRMFDRVTPELVGGTAVWLSHPHAKFLTGRAIMVNWDVDELVAKSEEIAKGKQLQMEFVGPFGAHLFQ
ncbi:hypothetical protein PFICI_03078 [Pestalotiopsis fici W106-1]|uniref:Uncharacterized protein n=1 Tax=Pestalotiopsis fici (strain W106-1 / CGMCC3.15140) TaxID=1229662 RepID=W3XG27_PESFW|nr:uncharacterized protein PFICI_03078 [Pestalotiopsis fici W106-1]ETS85053.1 hypothetical protein PFICI_03078 [Pestalotiopsis fici W106-1]